MSFEDIDFSNRVIKLPSGFSLIWPFRNIPKSNGPYELFIDNNALVIHKWFKELDNSVKVKSVLSPFHALNEQWLSNPSFRNNAVERIQKFLTPFIDEGVVFDNNYAINVAKLLKANEKESKSHWMITYLYVILLYRIVSSKSNDSLPQQLLSTLKDIDVPRFNGCTMLCTLAAYLKENKGIKLIGDSKTAFSYVASFVDLHSSNKNESKVDENYLRNRAGDLSMWLHIPILTQHRYQTAGDAVVVTQDNVLKNFIFRCFPAVLTGNGTMAFSFDEKSFDPIHSNDIVKKILTNIEIKKKYHPTERTEQYAKLRRLKSHVTEGANEDLIIEVNKVWDEWITPGFFENYSIQ
ncbi:TPA: hypothetical protein N3A08_005085 [Salmonella enterica subsp. salamae serovar 9,46:z4,z24:z39:z42]|nr:hypothetical protein [Salmonella enterica subsp. salamae serovar 9,46:z4,z24:z39:z42]HCM1955903.1 hypothetical protein [Salmonella enterica subsp. salamae serovar 9,46:z4,z24:z39:z42]